MTNVLTRLAISLSLASALGAPAIAQSVNVDFNRSTGPGAGPPSPVFTAASGQGGGWNSVAPTSASGGQTLTLTSADGSGIVTMKHKASGGPDSASFGSGDFAKLMADYAFGITQNGLVEVEFLDLEPGIYDVFVYTGLPQSEAYYTQFGEEYPHIAYTSVYLNETQLVGTATSGGHVPPPTLLEGVNYVRFTTGFGESSSLRIAVAANLAYGLAKVAVNGIQLRKWPDQRVHVTTTGAGDGSGRGWANAMGNLHAALAFAGSMNGGVQEVWIAHGTYKPALSDRTASFNLPTGIQIRGGFLGTESSADARTEGPVTLLSGNIGNQMNSNDNSYAVLRAQSVICALDRLTIHGGFANGPSATKSNLAGGLVAQQSVILAADCTFLNHWGATGGAIYADKTALELEGCTFQINAGTSGGAVHFLSPATGSATLHVTNCLFESNAATANGGAIYWNSAYDSGPWNTIRMRVKHCRFQMNSAAGFGGAIHATGERVGCWSSLFNGNSALEGGAIAFTGEAIGFVQSTMTSNKATLSTGGLLVDIDPIPHAQCLIGGSILWGNSGGNGAALQYQQVRNSAAGSPVAFITLDHSCVQGSLSLFSGSGKTNAAPMFSNMGGVDGVPGTADDDLRLSFSSPLLDAGLDTGGSASSTDLGGLPRAVDLPGIANSGAATDSWGITYVDMGCFEVQSAAPIPGCLGDLTADGVVDGADLALVLAAWGTDDVADFNDDGVVDGADLAIALAAWGSCS